MKKIFKIPLIMSLVIIFGCFSNAFAAINQNNNGKKIAETRKSVKLLDSATADDGGVLGTSNLNATIDNSAKVGDQLTSPEIAWKRYDERNKLINFSGSWSRLTNSAYYMSTSTEITNSSSYIKFMFYGTKLRILTLMNADHSSNIKISIDSINDNYSEYKASPVCQSLVYEKTGLTEGTHVVQITSNGKYSLDAIDIDSTGYLVDLSSALATGISLNKTTDSLIVGQTDTLTATVTPDSAANQSITWTSSDPNVATVDLAGKVTAIKSGTATITATTTDGSNLSASCVVTVAEPSNPTNDSDKAVLNITMTNGQVKQYNVTMDTINKFISWYRLRSAGSGDPFYEFDITQTSNPDIIKTDYVIFDKISSFEVDDYTK